MRRLVLFVEGEGEARAAPVLIKRLVREYSGYDGLHVDEHTFRIGSLNRLAKDDFSTWKNKLKAAAKRKNLGGVLLLLDGDSKNFLNQAFCPATAARRLAEESKDAGGGSRFSVAIAFACKEFESWFIAGMNPGRGMRLPADPETAPRDAKTWLHKNLPNGYRPTLHQADFAASMDFDILRKRGNRSFRRLERAVQQFIEASRAGNHFVSPS